MVQDVCAIGQRLENQGPLAAKWTHVLLLLLLLMVVVVVVPPAPRARAMDACAPANASAVYSPKLSPQVTSTESSSAAPSVARSFSTAARLAT
jgi:hypothetical protein